MSGATASTTSSVSPQMQNMALRAQLLAVAQPITQQIFTTTIAAPGNTDNQLQISPRFAGLLKRFKIFVTGTFNNTGATTAAALTPLGLANVLSNVQFTDTANNTRINSAGWHLDLVSTMKYGRPFGGIMSADPTAQASYGNNFGVISKAASIAAGANAPFAAVFDVPVAYSDADLRGAVDLNVTNATSQLQITLNPAPFVAAGDATLACYSGNTGTMTNVTVTVVQDYLSNIPRNPKTGLYQLPPLDVSTVYTLLSTAQTGLVAESDFPSPYTNFRDYMSTILIYDNGGTLNPGTDIVDFSLTLANYTNLFKFSPSMAALRVREAIGYDLPDGCYYFGSRHKPISPNSFGNIELNVKPSTVGSGSQLLTGWEYMARLANIGLATAQSVA